MVLKITVDGDEEAVGAEQATLVGYYRFVIAYTIEAAKGCLLEWLCKYWAFTYLIRLLHTTTSLPTLKSIYLSLFLWWNLTHPYNNCTSLLGNKCTGHCVQTEEYKHRIVDIDICTETNYPFAMRY